MCRQKASLCKIVIAEEKQLGWEDMKDGEIHRTIIYKALFAKCDRERDYEVAWREFERRGKNV
jgi:hypothetical protein